MPESRIRRKAAYTPPTGTSGAVKPNARWFVPVMVALLVLGLLWIVVYYISDAAYPVPGVGNWNILMGFGVLLCGFVMTTRWR